MGIFRMLKPKKKITVSLPLEPVRSQEHEKVYPTRVYPVQFLEILDVLALSSADLSQALTRSVHLTNTGHTIQVFGASDKEDEQAQNFLQNYSKSMFAEGAGADSLVNAMLRQITLKGALSLELVPNIQLNDIESVRLVPVESVRFKYIEGKRQMVQGFAGNEQVLNPNQYIYYALAVDERSPYGIPPFITALDALTNIQPQSIRSIKKILNKFGLLGFINAKRNRAEKKINESDNEYRDRLAKDLKRFVEVFSKSFVNGATASYDDTTIEHHSLTDNTRGAIDLFREIEQQVASGLDIDPALLGRSYSTTETYAGVVYHAFLAGNQNKRRLVKRALERIFEFKLLLNGYNVDKVKITFNPDPVLRPETESQVETAKIDNAIKKLQAGLIDADKAAQELGYEKAAKMDKNSKAAFNRFEANFCVKDSQCARDIKNPNATLCNASESIVEELYNLKSNSNLFFELSELFRRLSGGDEQKKKPTGDDGKAIDKRAASIASGQKHDAVLLEFQKLYKKEISEIQKQIVELPKNKHDLKNIISVLDKSLGEKFPKEVAEVLRPYLTTIWNDVGRHVWQDKDEHEKAKKAAKELAPQYLPKLENNLVHGFKKSYNTKLSGGESRRDYFLSVIKDELAGKGNNPKKGVAIIENIATELGKAFSKKQLFNAYRIGVSQGVMRHRNFSQVLSMEAVGYNSVEVVAIIDNKTSPICRTMNGRRIDMGTATSYAKKFLKTGEQKKFTLALDKTPVPYALGYAALAGEWEDPKDFTPEKTSGKSSKDIVAGMKSQLPPYHPNCRTTVVPGMPERVVNKHGRELQRYDDSLLKVGRITKAKQIEREFTIDEISSRINQARSQAKWTDANLIEHFNDHPDVRRFIMHSEKMEKIDNVTIEHYKKLSFDVLENFSYLYAYKVDKDNRVLFYDKERELATVVSIDNNHIVSCHILYPKGKRDLNNNCLRIL